MKWLTLPHARVHFFGGLLYFHSILFDSYTFNWKNVGTHNISDPPESSLEGDINGNTFNRDGDDSFVVIFKQCLPKLGFMLH